MFVYCPGQHDDARMCMSIAISTARFGGTIANYCQVIELHRGKDDEGKEVVTGARLKDRVTGMYCMKNGMKSFLSQKTTTPNNIMN